ncbi:MAG TPA: hypothetical protein PLU44_16800 [Candidatus Krumholzibacteria bacterium]|nr:hypothetical protein [Candidatus Krumholzibacteria bacterium]
MKDKITAIRAQVTAIRAAASTRPQGREDLERLAKLAATVSELEREVCDRERRLTDVEQLVRGVCSHLTDLVDQVFGAMQRGEPHPAGVYKEVEPVVLAPGQPARFRLVAVKVHPAVLVQAKKVLVMLQLASEAETAEAAAGESEKP